MPMPEMGILCVEAANLTWFPSRKAQVIAKARAVEAEMQMWADAY